MPSERWSRSLFHRFLGSKDKQISVVRPFTSQVNQNFVIATAALTGGPLHTVNMFSAQYKCCGY